MLPRISSFVVLANLAMWTAGCPQKVVNGTSCSNDSDCRVGELCVSGACFDNRGGDGGVAVACNSDSQCQAIEPDFVCNSVGLCELPSTGGPCTAIANCPIDQFCNFQSQVCTALQAGFCREASQCSGSTDKCSATPGGMGRCVECLNSNHCTSGSCLSNGTCAAEDSSCSPACETGYRCNLGQCVPVSSDCNPPCLTGEQCNQGVCYGSNGCPRNAHEVNGQCACDTGFVPSDSGNACVPEGQTCDPQSQLACQQQGGTWDALNCVCLSGGSCNPACPVGQTCQNSTCISVGGSCTSDLDCLMAGGGAFMGCDQASQSCACNALQGAIMCLLFGGEFNPDICDCDYPVPDAGPGFDAATPDIATTPDTATPDAAGRDAGSPDLLVLDVGASPDTGTVDICEQNGYYDDHECDTFCPLPDPDCIDPQNGLPGDACTVDADCSSYSAAMCVDHWPRGYCGGICDHDYYSGECGSAGDCICVDFGFWGDCKKSYCYSECTVDSDCRSDYRCAEGESGGYHSKICIPG